MALLKILPVDIFNIIADYLPINDLLSIADTSITNQTFVNNYLKPIYENQLYVNLFRQNCTTQNNARLASNNFLKVYDAHIVFLNEIGILHDEIKKVRIRFEKEFDMLWSAFDDHKEYLYRISNIVSLRKRKRSSDDESSDND